MRPNLQLSSCMLPLLLLLLLLAPVIVSKPLFFSTWSYDTGLPVNAETMWKADDWLKTDESGHPVPWMNLIMSNPVDWRNQTTYAALSHEIWLKTGVNVPVLWFWDPWTHAKSATNLTQLTESWSVFQTYYQELRRTYPHLPATPYGFCLGDEPSAAAGAINLLPFATSMIKETYPSAVTYLNFIFTDLMNTSVAKLVGESQLDWISSDEYYDVDVEDYMHNYTVTLYPHLRDDQKIIVLPFSAWCEVPCHPKGPHCALDCQPGVPLNLTKADEFTLSKAINHTFWYENDERVVGLFVYRFKNIWWPNESYNGADPCNDPIAPLGNSNGLGLVDRCGVNATGDYATPKTLRFYQELLDWL